MEQLKLPLLQIARQAELSSENVSESGYITDMADIAIKTIDSCLLSLSEGNQASLILEPVSVSATINSAAESLGSLAKIYNCELEIELPVKILPVMSDKVRLEAALTMLGYAFIEAQFPSLPTKKSRGMVKFKAYRTDSGVAAGIFSPNIEMSNGYFKKAMLSKDQSRQFLPEFSASSGAGIMLADNLLSDISSHLRVAHQQHLTGLVANLAPSGQLNWSF
ncbi:MAG TPA: hypothetical protein VMR34_01615 [Candidatus Saccharimonadales bacterium]|nr:hypothetical protein [Candidatus Saccharimonadales bacterium]